MLVPLVRMCEAAAADAVEGGAAVVDVQVAVAATPMAAVAAVVAVVIIVSTAVVIKIVMAPTASMIGCLQLKSACACWLLSAQLAAAWQARTPLERLPLPHSTRLCFAPPV
jgi:hypothetical protein